MWICVEYTFDYSRICFFIDGKTYFCLYALAKYILEENIEKRRNIDKNVEYEINVKLHVYKTMECRTSGYPRNEGKVFSMAGKV